MDYSCASKYFLTNQIEKNNDKNNYYNAHDLGHKNSFTVICNRVYDGIIPLQVKK